MARRQLREVYASASGLIATGCWATVSLLQSRELFLHPGALYAISLTAALALAAVSLASIPLAKTSSYLMPIVMSLVACMSAPFAIPALIKLAGLAYLLSAIFILKAAADLTLFVLIARSRRARTANSTGSPGRSEGRDNPTAKAPRIRKKRPLGPVVTASTNPSSQHATTH